MLGPSWPGRQFERKGWWPGEFNLLMFHAAALPQFLAFVTRLGSAANEPTFATVLRGLKRGMTSTDWRNALLQLEVHRASRNPGTAITFEPEISGSRSRADLMITPTDGSAFLVETASLARADVDQAWEEYEHNVWQAVTTARTPPQRTNRGGADRPPQRNRDRSVAGCHRSSSGQQR
ncbi:hypothetical protein [Nocardia farcinica]|uniref:hypothetical protein n=1 Tax=Nocardia farcinica TaxID=37329 RepID=UPI0015F11402|nr:hypothetical protein [Nocardia farcinica]MBA4858539.1 hypothetical protein [Nocardia farcinica]MBC9819112.1 hypothetical protein [Nocardia farcinica]